MKREFAEIYLPSTLQSAKAGFFAAMVSGDGSKAIQAAFVDFAQSRRQKPFQPMVDALAVSFFQEAGHVVILIEYPTNATEGEPLIGALVFGPLAGETLSTEVIEAAPVSYYLLVQDRSGTQITKLAGSGYVPVSPGPGTDRGRFVDWVVRSFSESGNVEDIPNDDPAMANAILHAQQTLPEVTERFIAGELQGFAVKVLIESGGLKEHFWLSDTKYKEGEFTGTIDEAGHAIKEIVPGTYVESPPAQVTDWMYVEQGKMVGNHTLRAMLDRMPPLQRAKYTQHLAGYEAPKPAAALPPPLPPLKENLPSLAQSLNQWPDFQVFKKFCRQIVGSRPHLTKMYKRMHMSPLLYLVIVVFALFKRENIGEAIQGMRNRGTRNPFLRDAYRGLSWNGELLIGHPIIANSMLNAEDADTDLAMPGLILGCLDEDEKVQEQAAKLAERLADIYMLGAENTADAPLEELMSDDTYYRWRRRVVPPEFTNGVRMELFDVLLFPEQLPPEMGPIPFLMKKAKPGKRAPILHIPWDCVKAMKLI